MKIEDVEYGKYYICPTRGRAVMIDFNTAFYLPSNNKWKIVCGRFVHQCEHDIEKLELCVVVPVSEIKNLLKDNN